MGYKLEPGCSGRPWTVTTSLKAAAVAHRAPRAQAGSALELAGPRSTWCGVEREAGGRMVSDCWLGCLGGGGHWVTGFTELEHREEHARKKCGKGQILSL